MLCARIITDNLWFERDLLDADSFADIKTKNHELSVWILPDDLNDKEGVDRVGLALAMTRSKPEEFYLLIIDTEEIKMNLGWDVKIESQDGDSHYKGMNSYHRNLKLYTFKDLFFMALYIGLMTNKKNYIYYNENEITDLYYKAIETEAITSRDFEHNKEKNKWQRMFNNYINSRKERSKG